MRSFDLIMVGAALVGLGGAACGQPTAGECSRAIGVYNGRYAYLTGTCEPTLQGRPLVLAKDDSTNTTKTMGSLSDVVTTEINLIGCRIGMRQNITAPGPTARLISTLKGDLQVSEDDSLSGQIARTEYMPDGTTVRCAGLYDATYTRDGITLGGAAQHALSQ
jgi:hypothetical protein